MSVQSTGSSTAGGPVTTTTGTAPAGAAAMDREAFLKLLVAQLAHQDPLKPMEGTEYVTQLAQFTHVEQAIAQTQKLDLLSSQLRGIAANDATSLVGKQVTVRGKGIAFDGVSATGSSVTLAGPAAKVTVAIRDQAGKLVRTLDLGAKPSGATAISWDGKDENGQTVKAGAYSISVTATNAQGAAVAASQDVSGTVTKVSFEKGFPEVVLDSGATAPISDLVSVAGAPPSPPKNPLARHRSPAALAVASSPGGLMSILNAMYSGVSGLSAEGQALGVVGDNVANTNTVGFKQSRAIFEDVLGSAVGAGGGVGAGVRMARSQQIFAQGSISNTGEPTDLALSGDGFFVVHGSLDGVTGDFYTRAGQTALRKDGTLVNANGLPLSGYKANPDGSFGSAVGPVAVSTAALKPKSTTQVSVTANIDATATPPAAGWDPQNPGATSNFSTALVTYDSLGNAHQVSLYFRNTGPNAWDVHALVNGSEIQGGPAGQNVEIAAGALSFTSSGALNGYTLTSGGTVNFVNAVPGQAIALDFGKSIAAGGTGLGGTTQFGAPSNVSAQSQDGYSSGDFTGVSVDSSGVVSGVYSNGQKIAAAQLAVAKFRANDGLARAGHGLWSATLDSGEPALGKAGSGGRAAIVAGALEQSNVDIATQFVDLIAHQRAFQASSKTITTADEMLQELVNLKR